MANEGISAGKAFLQLKVDDSEFSQGLQNSLAQLESFSKNAMKIGGTMAAMGAAITAPIAASLHVFSEAGSALADMSARTGVSVESLSQLKYAAAQTGTSLETVERALRFMAKSGQDVSTFDAVAQRIAAIADTSERAKAAIQAWGKSGAELLPMIANLSALREEATKAGVVMSSEAAESADALGDAIDKLKAQATAATVQIGEVFAPAITKAASAISDALPGVLNWVRENKSLVVTAGAVGAAMVALGGALVFAGTAANGAATAIRGLSVALALIKGHPIIAAIALAKTALLSVLGPTIIKWAGLSDTMETSGEAAKKATHAMRGTHDELARGNKVLDERAKLLASLSQGDRYWFGVSEEAKARTDTALKTIDAQIAATKAQLDSLLERGEENSIQTRDARTRLSTLQQQRDLTSGDAQKRYQEQQAKAQKDAQDRQEELRKQQAEAAKQYQESRVKLRDSVLNQLDRFSRPTRDTFNGRLMGQIFGSAPGDTREERRLKIDQDQLATLKSILESLKRSGVIIMGAS